MEDKSNSQYENFIYKEYTIVQIQTQKNTGYIFTKFQADQASLNRETSSRHVIRRNKSKDLQN